MCENIFLNILHSQTLFSYLQVPYFMNIKNLGKKYQVISSFLSTQIRLVLLFTVFPQSFSFIDIYSLFRIIGAKFYDGHKIILAKLLGQIFIFQQFSGQNSNINPYINYTMCLPTEVNSLGRYQASQQVIPLYQFP